VPLDFPIVDDIHLKNAPLREVICQVRFPTILGIAHKEPVEFQERVRTRFPILEIERAVVIEDKGEGDRGRVVVRPAYRFYDQNKTYMATLNVDSYAVSTKNYTHWPDFSDTLAYIAKSFQAVYEVSYATRIGLRYINILGTDSTGLESFDDVLDLLRGELTVMLRTDVILSPKMVMQRIRATTDEDQLTFRYGLIYEGSPVEPKFVLDFDHYIEGEIGFDDLLPRCDRYHRLIYNAFRWCIADGKLHIFQPEIAAEERI
jgi:uncharacterized protein (TIGR04255 family)